MGAHLNEQMPDDFERPEANLRVGNTGIATYKQGVDGDRRTARQGHEEQEPA